MTEFFAQPDDTGELQASELNTSLGESLGARAGEAAFSGLRTLTRNKEYSEAESAQEGLTSQIQRLQNGEDLGDVIANPQPSKLIPQSDAQDRVKQAGVTGIKLPAGDIREPVLDLMISHAHERQQYDAAISRGPSGLLPGALGFATEVGAGMIDPINVAAFSIPIMGEARFGMMLANAGESLASRAAVRAGVGAAQGAIGSTLLEPGQWWLHTRDGQDYTYADALRGVIMGAAMGGAFGAVHGGINDVRARAAGRPLAGSVDDLAQRALAGDEQAAGILQATPEGRRALAGEQPAAPAEAAPAPAQALPAIEETPPGITAEPRPATQIPEPEAVFTDLPAQVREDTVRASMADAINGNLGRGGELLKEAAKDDPRIAESLAAGRESTIVNAAEFSEPARAVFTDMSTQLKAAGMGEEEAAANAAVVAARYEARAARLEGAGGTAENLYRAEGIRVQRGGIDDVMGRSYGQPGQTFFDFTNPSGGTREARIGSTEITYGVGKDGVELTLIRTPRADRGQGQARAALEQMTREADEAGVRITLNADPMDTGVRKAGLVDFYKSLGFERNAGRKRDFSTRAEYIREPKAPRSFNQPATVPTFFSAVSRAINAARQEKASPEQWLATLRNTPGVKQEELQWLGLPDWLKEQTGTVTRKDIQDYVRANNIEVREVQKGAHPDEPGFKTPEDAIAYIATRKGISRAQVEEQWGYANREDYLSLADRLWEEDKNTTKFSQWTLPGGENYREMLLTLPEKEGAVVSDAWEARQEPHGGWMAYNRQTGEPFSFGTMTHDRAWAEGTARNLNSEQPSGPSYRSSHFDEPNILSHIRFNDRTIDGKKTLFIEEIQSDWHQAGKRKGYRQELPAAERASIESDLSGLHDQQMKMIEAGQDYSDRAARRWNPDYLAIMDKISALKERLDTGSGVPDAPFKTTWPELAFKRMIRYAAENGYEKIAWTPGEVQAERYDLSKHVDELVYYPRTRDLQAFKSGKEVLFQKDVPPEKLADHVGKEAAEKLINNPTDKTPAEGGGFNHTLSGMDLKVGGEGMKGFYDKILPATVNKLVKKYGAKVEGAEVEQSGGIGQWKYSGPDLALDSVDRLKFHPRLSSAIANQFREIHLDMTMNGMSFAEAMEKNGSYRAAEVAGGKLEPKGKQVPVHAIDLTEPLRKAATEEGFPLFQREPGGEMRGRITLADNRAIIDLFRSADKSTFMHETGHLWLDEMARDSARQNAPEGVRRDMDTVLNWLGAERPDAITTEQHEKFARGFETYLASGEAPTSGLRAVFERFKDWLSAIYRGLVGTGEEMPPEIRRVMDRMLATPEQLGGRAESAGADILPGPRARDPATFSLLEFLASRGGIRSSDPLISDLRSSIGRDNRFVPGFGQLIRAPRELSTAARMGGGRAPMTLDQAREAAVEAGYLHDEGAHTGGESTTTINTLLDAMDREMRGERVYRAGHEPARKADFDPDEEMHRLHNAIDDAVRDVGLDPVALPEPLRARILEIMTKEGERDPEIAYERAVMEETHYGEEADRNERIQDHIPGWDEVHDVGRSAQAPGGPAAQFAGPAGADAGAAPRRAGGDDRQAGGQRAAGAGNGAAAPAGRPGADWRALAAAAKSDDADLIAPSRAAAREKPPESTDIPEKAVSAAELKAKEAEQLLADILPRLTEEERIMMTDMLNAADRDRSEREQIVREGAACLAAGLVGAV